MPSEALHAGQRVFIVNRSDAEYLAMLAAEDYYGVGQGHFYGIVTGVYSTDRYRVMSDAGEELLLYRKDFDPIDTRSSSGAGLFYGSAIVVGLIIALAYLGVS